MNLAVSVVIYIGHGISSLSDWMDFSFVSHMKVMTVLDTRVVRQCVKT